MGLLARVTRQRRLSQSGQGRNGDPRRGLERDQCPLRQHPQVWIHLWRPPQWEPVAADVSARTAVLAAFLLTSRFGCEDLRVHLRLRFNRLLRPNFGLDHLEDKGVLCHQAVAQHPRRHPRFAARALALKVTRVDEPSSVVGPALVEAYIGRNGDPQSKADGFVAALRDGMGRDGGVALYKYCYLDVRQDTDVEKLFDSYRRAVETVRATHPEIALVHVTIPFDGG